ncbi:MAG: gliding motility-associated C-terminal domain-containing protein [Bacteroidales bacterium]|nr:gliding motility-associated C-terminal domain-containing protein [Bacteroidales bacterium]
MKMNKVYSLLALFLFSVFSHSGMNAQSTVGTDFWVTFLPNYDVTVDELSLIAAGNDSCTGVVTNPYTGWSTSFTVVPGIITNIYIPQSEAYDGAASDVIINKALHITTTDSISLYASNFYVYTFDVTNVLPTSSLGSEYVLQTYSDKAEFSVIATEDNTIVNIVLAENSLLHQANTPFSVTLNAGQCYQVQSASNVDLSGSIISVNDNKKIAVFAGNHWVHIPNNIDGGDHVVEQMMPTSAWGKKFVITNSMLRTKDKIRVTALNDNCQVLKDGVLLTTLNARQTYEFEITNIVPVAYLETSEPACVFLYFTGSRYGGDNGDPSMVIINPTDQRINNVTFSTFSTGSTGYQYFVNVITKTNNVSNMRLDGNNISSNFTVVPSMPEFSYARITINHGSHTLSNTLVTEESGFVAHIYGLAPWESFSYSAGSMVVEILEQPHLIVNGLNADDYPEGFEICNNSDCSFVFDLGLNYDPSNVMWNFGDGTTGEGYPITHNYDTIGQYNITCTIYILRDGVETLDTILFASLSVKRSYDTTIYASICAGEVYADNCFEENETGIYVDTLQTIYGCDSIVRLDLTVYPVYDDTILAYICEDEVYDYNGSFLSTDTVVNWQGQTVYGCDSVVTLILKTGVSYTDTIHASITEGQYYDEYGFNECEEGVYSRHLTTVNYGCDSVVYLVLDVNQRSDLYVPNCITPLSPTNTRFEIVHGESLDIDEVYIYNRAGEMLFHSIDNVEAWDGTYRGHYCPQAAYVYVIYYHEVGYLGKKEKVGTVVLLY